MSKKKVTKKEKKLFELSAGDLVPVGRVDFRPHDSGEALLVDTVAVSVGKVFTWAENEQAIRSLQAQLDERLTLRAQMKLHHIKGSK